MVRFPAAAEVLQVGGQPVVDVDARRRVDFVVRDGDLVDRLVVVHPAQDLALRGPLFLLDFQGRDRGFGGPFRGARERRRPGPFRFAGGAELRQVTGRFGDEGFRRDRERRGHRVGDLRRSDFEGERAVRGRREVADVAPDQRRFFGFRLVFDHRRRRSGATGADFRAAGHVGDPFRQHRAVAEVVAVWFPRRVARFQGDGRLGAEQHALGGRHCEAEVGFAFGPSGDGRQQGEQREQAGPGEPEPEQWRAT